MTLYASLALVLGLAAGLPAAAQSRPLRGIVHDPSHRPIAGATVKLQAMSHPQVRTTIANAEGEFVFSAVPNGAYTLSARAPGFQPLQMPIRLQGQQRPIVHLELSLTGLRQQVNVVARTAHLNTQTATTQTEITGRQIQRAPGADQANSLAMVTDFVPGAYMVHDMLHVRGGHQQAWFLDGIPELSTSIASNVGPQINPANIEELQVQTGGYSAEYDDRAYGFFNAITPSGFNQSRQGELIAAFGNYDQTNDLLRFASHTERLAYYASLNGNFSHLGLNPPSLPLHHDHAAGLGGLLTGIANLSTENQLRFVLSLQGNDYQIPNTPEQQAAGIADRDLERDRLAGLTWIHSGLAGWLLTVTPFYHFNRADYAGGPNDTPYILHDNRRSNYAGVLANLDIPLSRTNHFSMGTYLWHEHDRTSFRLQQNPGNSATAQTLAPSANSESVYFQDTDRLTSRLKLNGGIHLLRYAGLIDETAADPRVGGSLRLPRPFRGWPAWTLHGYYDRYYQEPPLDTLSGPLLSFAQTQGYGFIPLHGERDRQWDAGLSMPFAGWYLNFDHFHTRAANYLDHDEIGNSDVFLPLADAEALMAGNELSLHSPRLFQRLNFNAVWSNQLLKGEGPITGGLVEFAPSGFFYLDHDQRNTLNVVATAALPANSWASLVYSYGSGFLNGNGPQHLPPHSEVSLSMGKTFTEALSASLNITNLTNASYMLDNSNTFGGTHWALPRVIYGELRWKFHY